MSTTDIIALWALGINVIAQVLIGVYVYFTRQTFLEIQKQTNLQSRAHLLTKKTVEHSEDFAINQAAKVLHTKWKGIVNRNMPGAIQADTFLVLILKNRGRADVASWRLDVNISIEPSKILENVANIMGEDISFQIHSETDDGEQLIMQGEELKLCLTPISNFPKISVTWALEYTDIRGEQYTIFSGDKKAVFENKLITEFTTE